MPTSIKVFLIFLAIVVAFTAGASAERNREAHNCPTIIRCW